MCTITSLTRKRNDSGTWDITGSGSADCEEGSKVYLQAKIGAPVEATTVDGDGNYSFDDTFTSVLSQGKLKIVIKKPDGSDCCASDWKVPIAPSSGGGGW